MSKVLVELEVDVDAVKEAAGVDNVNDAISTELGWLSQSGMNVVNWEFADSIGKEQKEQKEVDTVVPPTLDELKKEYEHFIELTKDIRTIEQAREFEKTHHIPVEINGVSIDEYVNKGGDLNDGKTNENIEWIRYEHFGHLGYIYDYFDGKPTFDIYYGPYGEAELADSITIDDLMENYDEYLLDEIVTLAKHELNENGSIGYTMPDKKYHIYIYVDECTDYIIEPNRVIDAAMEPMGTTYAVSYNNFDRLREGVQWCFEHISFDKKLSLEETLNNATERATNENKDVAQKDDIEQTL